MEIDWNYKEEDWIFERSSGYAGSRNIITGEWLDSDTLWRKKLVLEEYQRFKQLCKFFGQENHIEEYYMNLFESFKRNGFQIFKSEN